MGILFIWSGVNFAQEPTLLWKEKSTGRILWTLDNIVCFDWDRQIMELTRAAAMDLMAENTSLHKPFVAEADQKILYEGNLVSSLSSATYPGPVIVMDSPDIKLPLLAIEKCYPSQSDNRDIHFSQDMKNTLKEAGVLGKIDPNNPPPPIERRQYGWFDGTEGLKLLAELFPETLHFGREIRTHLHLTGFEKLDAAAVADVNLVMKSKDGKCRYAWNRTFPFRGTRDWKEIFILKINPWEDNPSGDCRIKSGPYLLDIEVCIKQSVNDNRIIARVQTDSIPLAFQPGRALLPDAPNLTLIRFQKALKDCDWPRAIMYCSDSIREKAKEYPTPESFFQDVLPMAEIMAIREFETAGQTSRNKTVIRYRCEIPLKNADSQFSIDWELSVVNKKNEWVLDFPTKPLLIWIKHENLKMKQANGLYRIDAEQVKKGLEVHLVPLSKEISLGSQIPFRIELKNVTDQTLGYTNTSYMVNDPMQITGPDGQTIPFLDSFCQTWIGPEFLEPGQTVILAERYDARSQYHIIKPGLYTFQFRGEMELNPSNPVRMEVKPGSLSVQESVVEQIYTVLPEKWKLVRSIQSENESDQSDSEEKILCVFLTGKQGRKGTDDPWITVRIYIPLPSAVQPSGEKTNKYPDMEFWGHSPWGPVYVFENAHSMWPNCKEDLVKALAIRPPD
jgi:hypothetical protein